MWLKQTLNYWTLLPLKNEKLMPVLCDQVTQCSGSLTISLISVTTMNNAPII